MFFSIFFNFYFVSSKKILSRKLYVFGINITRKLCSIILHIKFKVFKIKVFIPYFDTVHVGLVAQSYRRREGSNSCDFLEGRAG